MIGPIFIALTQTGIQNGARAGIAVGSGIWISDIIVICLAWLFMKQLDDISHNTTFQMWMGLAGGIILILFGGFSFLKQPKLSQITVDFNAKSYVGFLSKGFFVNFVNPFTFVFWTSVMTTYMLVKKSSNVETITLLTMIMLTIMVTDTLKVFLAKSIRTKMTQNHLNLFNKIAGISLIFFGIVLIFRTNFN